MKLSRRQFVELLAGAGVSTMASSWVVDRLLALDAAGELPVAPGPGVESWVPTACGFCQGGCGLEIRRIDGIPVGVRGLAGHPVNQGKLCALPHAAVQALFSPDRVQRPLKRAGRRGQGQWTEIAWEEAEGMIVQRLQTLIGQGAGDHVAFLDGRRPGLGRQVAAGFLRGVGSPHHVPTEEPRCDQLARAMFGWSGVPGADLEHSRVVLLFHFDYLETDGSPVWQSRAYALARGWPVGRPAYISVGPRLLGSAAKCERWLPVHPGTEGLVALAMAHTILENNWEDREFLGTSTDWPALGSSDDNGLHRLVQAITPAVASELAGVPAARIEDATRRFVEQQPGVALVGPGTQATPTGALTIMAVNLLNVLVGAVGRRGTLIAREEPGLAEVWRSSDNEAAESTSEDTIRTPATLLRALLEKHPVPIELLFVRDANPVVDFPMGSAWRRGLASRDRTVVAFATELDETAIFADLVLPEPTFLERWDILTGTPVVPFGHASLQQPAIVPLFASRQSEETLVHVTNSLGDLSRVAFLGSQPEELARKASHGLLSGGRGQIEAAAKVSGGTPEPGDVDAFWSDFQSGIAWVSNAVDAAAQRRIVTFPGRLLGLGEEPSFSTLRSLVLPHTSGSAERYSHELVVFRIQPLREGAFANLPIMMEQAGQWSGDLWRTWAEIHPRTAAGAGVQDGDLVRVVSEFGLIDAVARVSQATPPAVVAVPLGFGRTVGSTAAGLGANVNSILAPSLVGESSQLREHVVRVNIVRA